MTETITQTRTGIPIVTRHYEDCLSPFLRWQVGVYVQRPALVPIYEPNIDMHTGSSILDADGRPSYRIVRHDQHPSQLCRVFYILGFGEHRSIAKSRALSKLNALVP